MLTVKVPSSKSMSHRLLMGAALAEGNSIVRNVLISKDIECTMQVLSCVGAQFTPSSDGIHVQGMRKASSGSETVPCYMHESGTSCRLLTAILAAGQGTFYVHGAPRLHERPMGALTKALNELEVEVNYAVKKDYLPLTLHTKGFCKHSVHINIDESSQYLSGLLMGAVCSGDGLTIYIEGKNAVSWPYVSLTLMAMENFGINVQMQKNIAGTWQDVDFREVSQIEPNSTRFCVPAHAHYKCGEYRVEGDWSNASYFIAAGSVGKKPLRIQGLNKKSLQGDRAMLDILSAMQGKFVWDGDDLIVSPNPLVGIDVDMKHCPDLVPTVAVLAAFAKGVTTITNVAHLRIKECDRIAAPAAELGKLGVNVDVFEDGLRVHGLGIAPKIPEGTIFSTHNDHRIAMSCALFGLNGQVANMDDKSVVQKSFPSFWEHWESII